MTLPRQEICVDFRIQFSFNAQGSSFSLFYHPTAYFQQGEWLQSQTLSDTQVMNGGIT